VEESRNFDKNDSLEQSNIFFCNLKPKLEESEDIENLNKQKENFLNTNIGVFLTGTLISEMKPGYKLRVIMSKIDFTS